MCCNSSPSQQAFLSLGAFLYIFAVCVTFVEANKNYTIPCEAHLSMEFGKIAYPTSKHMPNRCYWVIESTKERLELIFTDFVMKTTCCSCVEDFVEIRDGPTSLSPKIGRYCANSFPSVIYSTGKYLWINFESNFKVYEHNRVRVFFKSICGKHVLGYAGQISAFSSHSGMDECLYSVAVPSHRLRLKFSNMNVTSYEQPIFSCLNNYLSVGEDLVSMDSSLTASKKYSTKYCLSNPIPNIYSTKGQLLWFKFVNTPGTVKFTVTFSILLSGEKDCKNNNIIKGKYGTLVSPGYPFSYPKHAHCSWVIKGPPGKYIHLIFNTFNFGKDDDDCNRGYQVNIYSGKMNGTGGNLIGLYCSQNVPPFVVSENNVMVISSLSASGSVGFAAQFFALDKSFCNEDEFKCGDRTCVPFSSWCNGITDCQDASDEINCIDLQPKKYTFQWYKVWPITIIIAMLVMIVWLWRIGRRSLLTQVGNPQMSGNLSASVGHVSDYSLPDENFAPPPYSETDGHIVLSGKLPSYEEAVCNANDSSQRSNTPNTEVERPLVLINHDGTIVSYQTQRQQQHMNSGEDREVPVNTTDENFDTV